MKKILAMIALMLPVAVMAQEKESKIAIPQAEKTITMAAELSRYGYANKDALSLIQAARLSKQLGLTAEQKERLKRVLLLERVARRVDRFLWMLPNCLLMLRKLLVTMVCCWR